MANRLRAAISDAATTLLLAEVNSDFPSRGGVVLIESEQISYTHATDNELQGCTRGYASTSAASHLVNKAITLVSAASESISQNNQILSNLVDPVNAQDAATKAYVDAAVVTTEAYADAAVAALDVSPLVSFKSKTTAQRDAMLVAAVAASGTITYGSPDVLTAATGTVTVVDYTKLSEATAAASGDITFGTPDADSTVIVTGPAGGPFTFTAKASDPEAGQFVTADQLALLLNQINGIDAANVAGTISLTVETPGSAPNAWTVTGSGSYAALSVTFSGGQDHAVLTVAGHALTEGSDWTAATSNDVTADNVAAAIDALSEVAAPNPAAAAITVSAATGGTSGNSIALASSDETNLTISGATLSGGKAASTVTVDGSTFTCVAAAPGADEFSAIAELTSLIDALPNVTASDDGSTITVTAAAVGAAGNSIAMSKTGADLTLSGATLSGGVTAVKPATGTVIYNSTSNKLNFFNGTAWEAVTSA